MKFAFLQTEVLYLFLFTSNSSFMLVATELRCEGPGDAAVTGSTTEMGLTGAGVVL